jgi:hypothetical protein
MIETHDARLYLCLSLKRETNLFRLCSVYTYLRESSKILWVPGSQFGVLRALTSIKL